MLANQLRRGNLLMGKDGIVVVSQILDESHVKIEGNPSTFEVGVCLSFVTLTENELIKLGFEIDTEIVKSKDVVFRLKDIALSSSSNRWHVHKFVIRDDKNDGMAFIFVTIEYAHQIQNLVQSLTGEELIYNPEVCKS